MGSPVSEAAFCEDFEAVMFVIDRPLWREAAHAPHRPGFRFLKVSTKSVKMPHYATFMSSV
jgi:hypothetical protein